MNTKLDKREELIKKIETMPNCDFQKVTIFISGMEAEKLLSKSIDGTATSAAERQSGTEGCEGT